ncbi:phage minor tail protein L [Serratia liquefaciens]|uniref:phage minor tail protein L n=1 Tax=Serratia liquefaciens TaxID=614 RepID=UPI0022B96BE1|nr:phage minor tail protein L [Serratia liquefaciens]
MQEITPEMRIAITEIDMDALLELYDIDLTHVGGERFRLHNGVNGMLKPVVWQGREYEPYPIEGSGFTFNGKGPSERPTLTVSNVFGLITSIASDFDSAVGGLVTRRLVSVRFLDAVNFAAGNPQADASQEVVSRWVIEQMTGLNAKTATFTLSAPSETDGLMLPGRVILSDVCPWGYRSDECGYTGPPIADEFGKPTTDPAKDKCGRRLSDCKLRNNTGRIGCFISTSRLGN